MMICGKGLDTIKPSGKYTCNVEKELGGTQFSVRVVMHRFIRSSAVPRCIFVPLNRYGRPKIKPKYFRTRFVKRPYTRLGNIF